MQELQSQQYENNYSDREQAIRYVEFDSPHIDSPIPMKDTRRSFESDGEKQSGNDRASKSSYIRLQICKLETEPDSPSGPEDDLKRQDSLRNITDVRRDDFLTDTNSLNHRDSIVSRSSLRNGSRIGTSSKTGKKMLRIKKKAIMQSQQEMQAKQRLDRQGRSQTFIERDSNRHLAEDSLATINEYHMKSQNSKQLITNRINVTSPIKYKIENLIQAKCKNNLILDQSTENKENLISQFQEVMVQEVSNGSSESVGKDAAPDPYGLISGMEDNKNASPGTGGHPNETSNSPEFKVVCQNVNRVNRIHVDKLDEYMSYTESELESKNQIEMDSNVPVSKMPAHRGQDFLSSGPSTEHRGQLKLAKKLSKKQPNMQIVGGMPNLQVKTLNRVSSKGKLSKHSPRDKSDFESQGDSQSETSFQLLDFTRQRSVSKNNRVINRKIKKQTNGSYNQDNIGDLDGQFDVTLQQVDTTRFNHPFAHQQTFKERFSSRCYDIFDILYYIVFDFFEGLYGLTIGSFYGIIPPM